MAQVVVDSSVMREKANTLEGTANTIQRLFEEMLEDVNRTASGMHGSAIKTQQKQFASMRDEFEKFVADMKEYSRFLNDSAERYEILEKEATQLAQEQGRIF